MVSAPHMNTTSLFLATISFVLKDFWLALPPYHGCLRLGSCDLISDVHTSKNRCSSGNEQMLKVNQRQTVDLQDDAFVLR